MENSAVPGETPSPSPVPQWEIHDAPPITYNWVDITEEMKTACDELQLGELIHEPNFGLFEAMSAIEMMDPKMDAGMVGKQTKRKILTFKQAIEGKTIKIANLEYNELIGIMDQSLCCLLAWLEGQTLAQTVFTCLYLHDPNLVEDRCMRAYSLCMLKLCDIIREKVNKANVFEEEDFQTVSYGFKFSENLTDLRVIGMMKEMEEEYGRKQRIGKSKQASGDDQSKSEAVLCNAVLARIRFLKLFLQSVMAFGKKEVESLQQVKRHLNVMLEHLNTISNTVELGIKPVKSDDGHQIMHGFEPLVNQKLLPPTFPRYTTLRGREEIGEQYSQILKRLLTVTDAITLSGFQNILDFMDKFGQGVPCVLSRSLLQLTFLPENRKVFGHQLLTECVKESLKAFNSPPIFSARCPALQNHPEAKASADVFLQRASRVATTMVQAYGHNRARHREKLASLLEDLATLQDESERVDAQLHAIYTHGDPTSENSHMTGLSGWVTYHTLKIMTQYLYTGFELELYSPHELHYIYWYFSEVLYAWSGTIINRAEVSIARDEALAEMQSKGRSSKKAKKNKKKIRVHVKELRMLQGYQNMTSGCFKAMLGFFLGEKLFSPNFMLDSECTRYEHRFLPFVNITTPPFMLYNQFKEMTDLTQYRPKPSPEHLYLAASKHFGHVKEYVETLHNPSEEMQKFGRVAKTNFVVMKLLATGHKKDSPGKIEFDFSVHQCFPIFKIT